MSIKTLLRSFAAGEITPELAARVDLVKFQTGLQTARNFMVLPHGPAANRAGFEYVLETKDSSKKSILIPFVYNADQSYILEFGDQYIRFHTDGGTILESAKTITGITQANPGVVTIAGHGYSNGEWLYLSDIGGMAELNGRWVKVAGATTNTFQLTDIHGSGNIDTSAYAAFTSGGAAARVYEIASPYLEADLFDLHFTQSADVLTVVHTAYAPRELKRLGAANWSLDIVSFANIQTPPGAGGIVLNRTIVDADETISYEYVITAVGEDGISESVPSQSAGGGNNLAKAGTLNALSWGTVATAFRYNVYRKTDDWGLFGFVGQTETTGFIDRNITPNVAQTPPIDDNPFPGAGDYPGAVGYFQGRRWFGGTTNKPQNLWGTRSGTESDMTYSVPTRDDDRIAARLIARQANTIRHIVPLDDLLVLSSGTQWRVTSQGTDALTPSSIDPRPQDYIGASNVTPVTAGGSVLYAQARGGRLRELKYTWESQGYKTSDISIMAPHLFDDYTITSMCYARAPYSCGWATRDDGTLLGLTYVPEHDVAGWHHHDTDGQFECVTSVPEGAEDVVYAIVKRTVNGRTVRYVERMHSRRFSALEDCFFVDAGSSYDGSASTTISGLWHLVGKTVSILADGAVQTQQVVGADGTITLGVAASKVQVGLPYTSDLETLPLAYEVQAFAQATRKNVNRVNLRVYKSSGIHVGPAFDKLVLFKQRTNEPYGSPPSLYTGIVRTAVQPSWGDDGNICVRQSDPLPLTVLGLVPEVA